MEKAKKRKNNNVVPKNIKNNTHLLGRLLESDSFGASATRIVLAIIAFGGIMTVGAMMPNIFSALGRFDKGHDFEKKFNKKRIQTSVSYLRKKKLVKFVREKNGKTTIKITKDGIQRMRKFALDDVIVKKPATWDKKWRVVIFDIPEQYRNARDSLRRKLRELEFLQLQRSVFIHPYPAEDEILFIASIFDVERYVEILTVEKMLHDKEVCKFFRIQ